MKPDPESARKILLNAQQAMQRGDRQAARRWAEQAVALAPDSEEPWLFLAALASPRASVNYLERALKINPQQPACAQRDALGGGTPAARAGGQSSKTQIARRQEPVENPKSAQDHAAFSGNLRHPNPRPSLGTRISLPDGCPVALSTQPSFAQVSCQGTVGHS